MFDELALAEEKAQESLENRYKLYFELTEETYPKSYEEWLDS